MSRLELHADRRAGEQASTTSENDSPVVVTPATAPDGSGIGASVSVQF